MDSGIRPKIADSVNPKIDVLSDTAHVWSSAFKRYARRIARDRLKAEPRPGTPRFLGGGVHRHPRPWNSANATWIWAAQTTRLCWSPLRGSVETPARPRR